MSVRDELEHLLVISGHRNLTAYRRPTMPEKTESNGNGNRAKSDREVPTIEPKLLDIKQAAQYLSATVWYVRTLIWNRQIPAAKHGKKWLIDRTDLDKFITAQK